MINIDAIRKLLATTNNLKSWVAVFLFLCLLGYISLQFKDEIKQYINKPDPVQDAVNEGVIITNILKQMREEFNAGRAYISIFHNGQIDYTGSHVQRSSMAYESIAPGIAPIKHIFENIRVTSFACQMQDIINEKVLATHRDSIKDEGAKAIMKQLGISHSAALPYYHNNRIYLVVGVDWINREDEERPLFFEDRFRRYVNNLGRLVTQPNSEVDEIYNLRSEEFLLLRGIPPNFKPKKLKQYKQQKMIIPKQELTDLLLKAQKKHLNKILNNFVYSYMTEQRGRGRPRIFETAEDMIEMFNKYKKHTKSNPFRVQDYVGKDGIMIYREKERCLTMEGFENFCQDQINMGLNLSDYFANRDNRYFKFTSICSRIRREIRDDQIQGGMVGIFNASITQRLNGLTDKQEMRVIEEQPLFGDEDESS